MRLGGRLVRPVDRGDGRLGVMAAIAGQQRRQLGRRRRLVVAPPGKDPIARRHHSYSASDSTRRSPSAARPPRCSSSISTPTPTIVPPSVSTRRDVAAAVPPVASTSSMIRIRSSGWMASRCSSSLARAVLEAELLADDGPRQLAGLAHRHERRPEAVGDRRGDDEATGLDPDDPVDLEVREPVAQLVDGPPELLGVAEQRRDVPEHDARLRPVRDVTNERAQPVRHRRPSRPSWSKDIRRPHADLVGWVR